MSRLVILGGGVAGLTAAYRRKSEGETVVLEADPAPGGSVKTAREGGFVVEGGPSTLRTTAAADRLIADLGLASRVVAADPKAPRWIVRGGRPRAVVPGPTGLFNTVFTTAGKLRLLKEPFVPGRPADLEDESVASFFARRFGEEAARYGAGPMVSGVYAGDPDSLSMRSGFPKLWEAEGAAGSVVKGFLRKAKEEKAQRAPAGVPAPPRHRARTLTFDTGLYLLIETLQLRLSERSGCRIETNAAAVSIEGPLAGPGPRWRVRTAGGRSFEADALLSTLDAPPLARLLGDRLPRSGAGLAAMKTSPVTVVALAWPRGPGAPRGFGALVPRGEGIRSLGVLYPSSLFAGRAPADSILTTSFLGGALDPAIAAAPDAEVLAVAREEAKRLHPGLTAPARSWTFRWPAAIPQLPLLHHRTLAAVEEDLRSLPGLVLTGGWRDGIAMGARIERAEALGNAL
ncbi:MAG TPA: protoporphyrinogen oxidase [Thermoanaerobaculia bacterium]|nr:protoporphyrinogen oxidase [Thermoanaerobaculia bacterium]